jgi:type IV pilus assembly protein PilO
MDNLRKIPFTLFAFIYAMYVGYQYYEFSYSSSGQVETHRNQVTAAKTEIDGLRKKLDEGNKFLKSLDVKREEIKSQVRKLTEYQGALSEFADVPSLIKMIYTEAKKIDMKVDRIEPGKKNQKEYYLEQEFHLDVRGSYQQIVLFIHRISQLQRILRIEGFQFKQSNNQISSRTLTLSGELSLRAYQYTLSKEDQLGTDSGGAKR